jgi:hypothetical protein
MKLIKSRVVFNQEDHTYTLDGKKLKGITGMIGKQLFPDKYKEVPEAILKRAAERGSLIHIACELADDLGVTSDKIEVKNYVALTKDMNCIASEYLVSDNENFASSIDKVYQVGNKEVDLGDIKTTYKADTDYLSWQLSIYAYFFELQNPDIKVRNIFGIWLRDEKSKLIGLERIPVNEVKKLLECEVKGESYLSPIKSSTMPAEISKVQQCMINLESQIKELTEKRTEMLDGILKIMIKNNVDNYKSDKIQLIRKHASLRETLDKKKLSDIYPDIDLSKCMKISNVKESITFKVL